MIERLILALQQAGLILSDRDLLSYTEAESVVDGEDIADALWLASWMGDTLTPSAPQEEEEDGQVEQTETDSSAREGSSVQSMPPPLVSAYLPETEEIPQLQPEASSQAPESGLPIEIPAAPALPDSRLIGRALRPLMRRVPSLTQQVLDEPETVERIAEQDIWAPVLKPARERWFDLELVVEASSFSFIWESTLEEFQQVLERQGAFRNVRTWRVEDAETAQPKLEPKSQSTRSDTVSISRSPRELIDASGRRVVLYVSDCRSVIWQQGIIHDWLKLWSEHGPTTIVQLLPERLWDETELDVGFRVQVGALTAGVPNSKLLVRRLSPRNQVEPSEALTLPVVTLTQDAFQQWALVVAAAGQQRSPARLFDLSWVKNRDREALPSTIRPQSAAKRIELFEATASPTAQRLAGMLAAVPVSFPVMNLIQKHLLKEATPVHVAEVFSSDLLTEKLSKEEANGTLPQYEFAKNVRELLNERTPLGETIQVLDVLSQEIAKTLGFKIKSFTALLFPRVDWSAETQAAILPFAQIATQVLYRLGGEYAELALMVEKDALGYRNWITPSFGFPLEPREVVVATVEFSDDPFDSLPFEEQPIEVATITLEYEESSAEETQRFEFEVATIERQGTEWVIQRRRQENWGFIEVLTDGVVLEMMNIPAGTFLMGSPADEPERGDYEGPQHEVSVSQFFMSRYPITQAQWRFVASLPEVERDLKADPSRFKGDNRPVEQVSWYDAVEFCKRLTQLVQRPGLEYRLPTEAEWEYACRAGTTTPFHFGETISPELATYDATVSYANDPTGDSSGEITPVDRFSHANDFGLCDMHGNVYEWCLDYCHNSYENAPTDGSAWLTEDESTSRVIRGGSWIDIPRKCRSASRNKSDPDNTFNFYIGFRVVCAVPRSS